jgi:hypothetical protein
MQLKKWTEFEQTNEIRERVRTARVEEAKPARTTHAARVTQLKKEKEFAIPFIHVSGQ